MNYDYIEQLWIRLKKIYHSLESEFCNDGFECYIGRTSNDTYKLRAFITIMKNSCDSGEVSVTVDVSYRDGNYFIESDICDGNNVIVAEGPSRSIEKLSYSEMDLWSVEYESFIACKVDQIKESVQNL